MSSAPTLEQYLSIDTNFDSPYFLLDNTFKAFFLSRIVKMLLLIIRVRYHSGGFMKLNACILILAHMVYL
jgi:hypothetical protein